MWSVCLALGYAEGFGESEGIHNWAGLFLLWYLDDNSWQNGITVKWDKLKLILSFELFWWFLAFWPIPLKMGVYVMLPAPPVWIILLSPTVSFMILPLGDVKVRNGRILHIYLGFKYDFFTETSVKEKSGWFVICGECFGRIKCCFFNARYGENKKENCVILFHYCPLIRKICVDCSQWLKWLF